MQTNEINIERVMSGHTAHLSNDDISIILVELVGEINKLKKEVKNLESELYSIGGLADDINQHQNPDVDGGLYGGLADDY